MKHSLKLLLPLSIAVAPLPMAQVAMAQTSYPKHSKSLSWIRVQASTDKAQYVAGEPIKVTLKATNIWSRDAYLKYSSGQRFELKLFKVNPIRSDGRNEPVYTWSANKSFMMMTEHIKLKQGESKTYQGEIGSEMGELAPGIYVLDAQLSNSSQISAEPILFTVAPPASAPASAPATAPATAPASAPATAPNATLSATTDKTVYRIGETVKVDCLLQNNPATATTFTFGSGQNYDVFIRNAAGESIWNWAANKRFLMVSQPITLAAGAQQKFTVEWDGRALPGYDITPGRYTVEAEWASMPAVKAPPIAIEIR